MRVADADAAADIEGSGSTMQVACTSSFLPCPPFASFGRMYGLFRTDCSAVFSPDIRVSRWTMQVDPDPRTSSQPYQYRNCQDGKKNLPVLPNLAGAGKRQSQKEGQRHLI
jgi:hypothetical protein